MDYDILNEDENHPDEDWSNDWQSTECTNLEG